MILEIGELIVSVSLVYYFWKDSSLLINSYAFMGAFVGLVPDFLEAPRNFLKWEPKFLKPINTFHGKFHHSTPNKLLGLTPQVILVILIYLLK
jgi:hypothetical protein